ncbi:MAG: hypothetical protein HRU19_30700 [Pseudobacteriovorax sp.]|nr:hypothetical protein [Pseudobacteriovorax sp.]
MIRFALLVLMGCFLTNCATLNSSDTLAETIVFEPEIEDEDDRHRQSLVYKKKFQDKIDAKAKPKSKKVYHKRIPEGLDYKWVKSKNPLYAILGKDARTLNLSVKKGYRHKLISKVVLKPRNGVGVNYALFLSGTNWSYTDTWRKVACYPQIPLYYVTLGYWGMIPTWYPCVGDEEVSRKTLMKDLKLAVEVAGGDFAVAVFDMKRSDDVDDIDKEPTVNGVQMLIYKVDPRFNKSKNMKTEPLRKKYKDQEEEDQMEERDL